MLAHVPLVVVAGDLNDAPAAATTQLLTGPADRDLERADKGDPVRLVNLAPWLPVDRAHSRVCQARAELIDHIFVSTPLARRDVTIEALVDHIEPIGDQPSRRRDRVWPDHAPVVTTMGAFHSCRNGGKSLCRLSGPARYVPGMRASPTAVAIALTLAAASCSDGEIPPSSLPTSRTGLPEITSEELSGTDESLKWSACTDSVAVERRLECATITVPLDYDDPSGESIEVALIRLPARGERSGTVLFSPGGPGASGFSYIANYGTDMSTRFGIESFDLVGFDQRGVDRSNGISCLDDATKDKYLYLDPSPDTPEEQALDDEYEGVFGEACLAKYGDTLHLYSTVNTARDMDAIRASLGDEQVSILGASYGTFLGATYATMFPDRVRAMVLDSASERSGDTIEQQYTTQLVGLEEAFDRWAEWCQGTSECKFTASDVPTRWDVLLAKLDKAPLPAPDGRQVNNAVMTTATIAALFSPDSWPDLGAALAAAEVDEPGPLLAMADKFKRRRSDGTFESLFDSLVVIRCASGIAAEQPDDPAALVDTILEVAPRFGADYQVEDFDDPDTFCEDLTEAGESVELSYSGTAPIVVTGGTNDPATPFRWAEEMTAKLGKSARLVTYDGDGHGHWASSSCIADLEAAVIVDLELPPPDVVCAADADVEQPQWWSRIPEVPEVSEPDQIPALISTLGLDRSFSYVEIRTSELPYLEVAQRYETSLMNAGFEDAGERPFPATGVSNALYMIDDEGLYVTVIGSESFEDADLAGASASVPNGQTVVMLVYVPTT
jgi:pimeloyl-ACP methyl ester carboxylesterase